MNREETKRATEVMLHYANGGEVQYRKYCESSWSDTPDPRWNWDILEYSIKPDPVEVTVYAVVSGPLTRNWTLHETLPLAQAQLHEVKRRGCDSFIVPLKGEYLPSDPS